MAERERERREVRIAAAGLGKKDALCSGAIRALTQ
jgi:hypothetical protein